MENIISIIYVSPSKKLIKSGILLFVLLTALYLLLLGTVLDNVDKKKKLSATLERESQVFYTLQAKMVQQNKNFNPRSFLELGYAENQKFEVIKTIRNVASRNASHY